MKTFRQFQEGIFDLLPKTKYETHGQAVDRAIKIDPKSVVKTPYKDPNKPTTPASPRSPEFQHGRKLKDVLPGGLET